MKKMPQVIILFLFVLVPVLIAATAKWSAITVQNDADDNDRVLIVDDPNGTPASKAVPRNWFLNDWTGNTSITSLGTIGTGTWEADVIDHERGGLEADINAYSGLVAVSGGSTAEVDSLDEIEAQLADVTLIYTEALIPACGTDPDVDASGEFSLDTDGANEPNDIVLRTADTGGDTQYAIAQVLKSIQGTIITPNDLADGTRDACPVWENNTGMTFTITMIRAWSDTDDTAVNIETVDSDWDNNATVDALTISTDEVANFSTEETTITAATIAAGSLIVLDFDDTDTPGWVKFNIMGYFNADVD